MKKPNKDSLAQEKNGGKMGRKKASIEGIFLKKARCLRNFSFALLIIKRKAMRSKKHMFGEKTIANPLIISRYLKTGLSVLTSGSVKVKYSYIYYYRTAFNRRLRKG